MTFRGPSRYDTKRQVVEVDLGYLNTRLPRDLSCNQDNTSCCQKQRCYRAYLQENQDKYEEGFQCRCVVLAEEDCEWDKETHCRCSPSQHDHKKNAFGSHDGNVAQWFDNGDVAI